MPKEKYIITSNCRIDGKHTEKGTILELDRTDPKDADRIGILDRAGRIAVWTQRNEKFIQDEIRRENDHRERQAQERAKAADSMTELSRRLAKALQPA